jgi:hypothetical protein
MLAAAALLLTVQSESFSCCHCGAHILLALVQARQMSQFSDFQGQNSRCSDGPTRGNYQIHDRVLVTRDPPNRAMNALY